MESILTYHPIIGITSRYSPSISGLPAVQLLQAYARAILDAGGTPILLPPGLPERMWQSLLGRLDGILFSGGADIGINHFNGTPHPMIHVDPDRDAMELPLLRAVVHENKPFLAICRGLQVVNVALGGTLYTHIIDQHPNALQHSMPDELPRTYLAHDVNIMTGSKLFAIIRSTRIRVNSLHHQGIKDLAPGLVASAYAPDGLIEGVEIPNQKFAIAVQWHPEWMTSHEEMRRLFDEFVTSACNST